MIRRILSILVCMAALPAMAATEKAAAAIPNHFVRIFICFLPRLKGLDFVPITDRRAATAAAGIAVNARCN